MTKKIVVIGGGPAGYTAALRASQLGAKVILIEANDIGGTCLNVGCIPTKSLLNSSGTLKKSQAFFSETNQTPWIKIMERKNQAIKQLREGVKHLLKTGKVELVVGEASLKDGGVEVVRGDNKQFISADVTIIATGSKPVVPPIPGSDLNGVMTSDDLIYTNDAYPESMTIVGAGVIGMEFATILSELDTSVSVVETDSRILPMVDSQVAEQLKIDFEKSGVSFYLDRKVNAITQVGDSLAISLSDGQHLQSKAVLMAVGRKPNIERLNVPALGIAVENGRIQTNAFYQTAKKDVYAVGDCSSPIMLAHVAMTEARIAVEHCLGEAPEPLNYEYVPQCIYSHPEIAAVGLTDKEAERRGFDTEVGMFPLTANGKALIEGGTTGFIKVVSEKKYKRVLGVHILAPHATEMIAEACLALTLEATVNELLETIHPHPTIIEAIPEAIHAIHGEAIHLPMK